MKKISPVFVLIRSVFILNTVMFILFIIFITNYNSYLSSLGMNILEGFNFSNLNRLIFTLGIISIILNILSLIAIYFYSFRNYFNILEKIDLNSTESTLKTIKSIGDFDNVGYFGSLIKGLLKIFLDLGSKMREELAYHHKLTDIAIDFNPNAIIILEINARNYIEIVAINKAAMTTFSIEERSFIISKLFLSILNQSSQKTFLSYVESVDSSSLEEEISLVFQRKDLLAEGTLTIRPIFLDKEASDPLLKGFVICVKSLNVFGRESTL